MNDLTMRLLGRIQACYGTLLCFMLIAIVTVGPTTVFAQQTTDEQQFLQQILQEKEAPSIEILVIGSFHFKNVPDFTI